MTSRTVVWADVIRRGRERKGFTQKGLAMALGVTPEYISMLEREERIPGLITKVKMAQALSVWPILLLELAELGMNHWVREILEGDLYQEGGG